MSRVLLAVALLVLGACDSAAPASDDPIVGTWALTGSAQQELVTVNAAQTIVDAAGVVTNDLVITGSQSGRVPFGAGLSRYGAGVSFALTSYDPTRGPVADPALVFYVNDQPDYAAVQLDVQGTEYVSYGASSSERTGLFTRAGWTYTLSAPLQSYDGSGRSVRVTGQVDAPNAPAGRGAAVGARPVRLLAAALVPVDVPVPP